MGHTNSTANLALPQFIGTDKPTWLGDVNGAFAAIDGYVGTNDAAVAAAASDASSAISQASAAVNTANTANTTAGNASTAANNAVGVANTANAIAGTVDAKVGLLADLDTTDRTSIVNAINEVNGKGLVELWVNPDASQSFPAQTVSIVTDLQLDSILVEIGSHTYTYAIYGGEIGAAISAVSPVVDVANGVVFSQGRTLTLSATANGYDIAITGGEINKINTYGSAGATTSNDQVMKPVRIFGVLHQ